MKILVRGFDESADGIHRRETVIFFLFSFDVIHDLESMIRLNWIKSSQFEYSVTLYIYILKPIDRYTGPGARRVIRTRVLLYKDENKYLHCYYAIKSVPGEPPTCDRL